MHIRHLIPLFALLSLAAAPAPPPPTTSPAPIAAPLNELLPQDTLAFAELDPTANPARRPNQGSLATMGLQALQSTGALGNDASLIADILGLASEAGSRRTCFALLDADLSAAPIPNPPNAPANPPNRPAKLDANSVQLLWIIETNQPADMVERLTRLLTHFSTQSTVRQTVKKTAEDKKEFVEFHDTRWPAWLNLAWAQELSADPKGSPRFILALGAGAMEHYLADRPVGEVPWRPVVTDIDAAAKKIVDPGALLARIYVSPKLFRDRFPEAMSRTMLGRLFASIDLATADTCIFTARIRDRAVTLNTGTSDQGHLTIKPWTIDLPPTASLLKAVPQNATAYLALNMQWADAYKRTIALLDAILTDPTDPSVEKTIASYTTPQNIDIHVDILANLQPWVLIHDSPQHPLGLPLMVTAVAAAEPGSDIRMKAVIEKLTTSAATALDQKTSPPIGPAIEPTAGPAPAAVPGDPQTMARDMTRMRIRTDPDGISYLQFGLVGPAWGWVENRLVVSWSPGAVRTNAAAAGRVTSSAFAPPTTQP